MSDEPTPDLRALTCAQAEDLAASIGLPRFRGEQAWRWVHGKGATSWDQMTNIGPPVRARLAAAMRIDTLTLAEVQTSRDGTRKLRFTTRDGFAIESVLIPDGDKTTQCISSQVGCAIDCQFCATARLGLTRNLDAGEIADQVYRARALLAELDRASASLRDAARSGAAGPFEPARRISNLVYMGMGEPLHNFDNVMRSLRILTDDRGLGLSQRRITVSTAGMVPRIERLGAEDIRPNLAVSLNAPSDEIRDRIMPINRKWNLGALLAAIRAYPLEHRRRVTFEYVLLAGLNDSKADAGQLAELLRGLRCKVNIIPWNPHPEAPYQRPAPAVIEAFQAECKRRGLPTYLRTPRGDDIDAACGQLANRTNGELLVPLRRRGPALEAAAPPAPALD
jgi:23S rRNA (adenine2503-C2)-methyltransferase